MVLVLSIPCQSLQGAGEVWVAGSQHVGVDDAAVRSDEHEAGDADDIIDVVKDIVTLLGDEILAPRHILMLGEEAQPFLPLSVAGDADDFYLAVFACFLQLLHIRNLF